MHEFMIPGQR